MPELVWWIQREDEKWTYSGTTATRWHAPKSGNTRHLYSFKSADSLYGVDIWCREGDPVNETGMKISISSIADHESMLVACETLQDRLDNNEISLSRNLNNSLPIIRFIENASHFADVARSAKHRRSIIANVDRHMASAQFPHADIDTLRRNIDDIRSTIIEAMEYLTAYQRNHPQNEDGTASQKRARLEELQSTGRLKNSCTEALEALQASDTLVTNIARSREAVENIKDAVTEHPTPGANSRSVSEQSPVTRYNSGL